MPDPLHGRLDDLEATRPDLWLDVERAILRRHAAGLIADELLSGDDWLRLAPPGDAEFRWQWLVLASAVAPWRYTQRVYRIDPDLLAELVATPLTGAIPASVLQHLPDYSVYVDLAGLPPGAIMTPDLVPVVGVWCARVSPPSGLSVFGTEQSIALTILDANGDTLGASLPALTLSIDEIARTLDGQDADPRSSAMVASILPAILYLCSDEPSIRAMRPPRDEPRIPIRRRAGARPGRRLYVPARPRVVEIGRAYGDVIRATRPHRPDASGRGVQPHLRRGHWALRWTGSREEGQTPVLRWIMPTVIGARTDH